MLCPLPTGQSRLLSPSRFPPCTFSLSMFEYNLTGEAEARSAIGAGVALDLERAGVGPDGDELSPEEPVVASQIPLKFGDDVCFAFPSIRRISWCRIMTFILQVIPNELRN